MQNQKTIKTTLMATTNSIGADNGDKNVKYIVYNTATLDIIHTAGYYGRSVHDKLGAGIAWINVSHPKTKDILAKINKGNNTNH
jgi:hypothetical protein